MPNYCQNQLTVIDPSPEFKEFMVDGLDFNKIVPCPNNPFEDLDWCVDNWGTKWNVDKDQDLNFDNEDTIVFSTAWNPPIPVIEALAAKFPDLKFTLRYFEGGNFFGGIVEFSNGVITLDEELEDHDLEDFAEEFFAHEFVDPDHDDSDLLDYLDDEDDELDDDEDEPVEIKQNES
jgi:hypothetical protein